MNEYKKTTVYFCFVLFLLSLLVATVSTTELIRVRRISYQYREQLVDATNTNRRLAEAITDCNSLARELATTTERSIRTARDAIELVEEIRVQVQSLEMVTGDWNSDEYYSHWDRVFELGE